MGKVISYGIRFAFLGVAMQYGLAHSYGPPPGVTGAPGDNPKACTLCHTGALNTGTGSVKIVLAGVPMYIPGVKQRVTVLVADPTQQRWGFELTARLNSDPQHGQAGDLSPVDNLTEVICEDAGPKPCLSGVSFIEHTSAGTRNGTKNGVAFQFDWTPPATNAGPVTFYVAGNAANGNAASTGDLIYTSSLQLDPVVPTAPVVTAGNIVSAATGIAGPVAANTWMTVYGTNLGATTRSWTDTDFINGAMPVSLDGVSVILTTFGAPRLASIGYVSPTQINFLLPSDTSSTTAQVQVRNTAGITAQMPLTVQANAPQLLTSDGKHALGTHADGTLFGTVAAKPGETVVLYGTGCGPVTPALIPSQVPVQAAPLASLPQITIGGAPATVTAGSVLTGTAGVYQISVQIPAATPDGDQPVVVQAGTFSSATTLISVKK